MELVRHSPDSRSKGASSLVYLKAATAILAEKRGHVFVFVLKCIKKNQNITKNRITEFKQFRDPGSSR